MGETETNLLNIYGKKKENNMNKLKPTLEAFINKWKPIYEVDKHVRLMEMTHEMFVKKWTPYNHLVT